MNGTESTSCSASCSTGSPTTWRLWQACFASKARTLEAAPQDAATVLNDAENRLQTIARIHRRLYDPAIIDMPLSSYLEGFVKDILDASGANNIVCVIEVPPVSFDLTRLVTLSLLINEVITNSIKHGFGGRESGTISIKLDRQAQNYVLAIKDDGRSLHNGVDSRKLDPWHDDHPLTRRSARRPGRLDERYWHDGAAGISSIGARLCHVGSGGSQ